MHSKFGFRTVNDRHVLFVIRIDDGDGDGGGE